MPYRRNPFFTGREELLKHLHDNLASRKAAALTQAISGLGGIGKTQTVVEYAYRYRDDYHDVFWIMAATRERIIASFIDIARLLNLPEKDEQKQKITVQAVKRWLEQHNQWLMIVDNADNLALAEEFLPTGGKGHILLTTRAQAIGTLAKKIDVEKMDKDEGMLFLLRRARVLTIEAALSQSPKTDRVAAETIVKEMDGLPLALDQAGAYIEETLCGVSAYLVCYRQRQVELLKRRGGTGKEHPEPVATTWSLSFEQVEQLNPMAADLLRVCAFLSPDTIPEELLLKGAAQLGTHIQPLARDATRINDAIGILLRYSLVERDLRERTFSIHRLVQAVMRDTTQPSDQEVWTKRVIAAMNTVFPQAERKTWDQCERLLPHALACIAHTRPWKSSNTNLASLLMKVADHLARREQYFDARDLYHQALKIWERTRGPNHFQMAHPLYGLGEVYRKIHWYEKAEPFYQRALHIYKSMEWLNHSDSAYPLNGLADLYTAQGKYVEAEPLYRQALRIWEQTRGQNHPQVTIPLNGLADLYTAQRKYAEAELLYQRAVRIWEQASGRDSHDVAVQLDNIAGFYGRQGRYAEAEPLYQRALYIWEQILGQDDLQMITPLNGLADLYIEQGRYAEAELLYLRALHIYERMMGPDSTYVAIQLDNLIELYTEQARYTEAEPLCQRALRIWERTQGPDHSSVAEQLDNLGNLYTKQGRYVQAESLYQRAMRIYEKMRWQNHLDASYPLNGLANLYAEQARYAEAEPLLKQALAIREKELGPEHPDTVTIRENYHALVKDMKQKGKGSTNTPQQ